MLAHDFMTKMIRNTLTFSIIFSFSKFSYMSPCNILGAILKFSNLKKKIDSLLNDEVEVGHVSLKVIFLRFIVTQPISLKSFKKLDFDRFREIT
jgi:hypothetical protein